MDLIITLVLGLVVGAVAKLLMPGKDPGGIVITLLLGVAGAFVGTLLGRALGLYARGETAGFLMSVLGAFLLLLLYRLLRGKKAPRGTSASVLLPFLLAAGSLTAQERPANWKVRFDRPNASDTALSFVTMAPGWHVTTGPAAILYDPAKRGEGRFRVEAEIFLFPPQGDHLEGFGVFIGGKNLDREDQAYTYFLIRKDGKLLVKERTGASTKSLVDWTEHPAIVKHPGGEQNVKNVLAVDVGPDAVDFSVNGQTVTTLPRSAMNVDGVVGLRVNHRLNLHVSRLVVTPRGGAGGGD